MKNDYANQREFLREVLASQGINLDVMTTKQRTEVTKEYILCLHRELNEVLDTLDWKSHRKLDQPSWPIEALSEELIDVQKYLWNLAHIWNVDYDSYRAELKRKSYVVERRWELEQSVLTPPAIACDIDEVLFRWKDSFREWLAEHHPAMLSLKKSRNPIEWEKVKKLYRESGAKEFGEPHQENIEALRKFEQIGCSVALITYRPRKTTPNLEYETLRWVRANAVPCHKLFWAGSSKAVFMSELLKACHIFIDDDRDTCGSVAMVGARAYWLTTSGDEPPAGCKKVSSVQEVYDREYGQF
jgi:hypothetical protein